MGVGTRDTSRGRRSVRAAIGLTLLAAIAVGCSAPSPAPGGAPGAPTAGPAAAARPQGGAAAPAATLGPQATITIGYPVISATFMQHFVGAEQGFWEAENLQIEPALTNGVPAIVQAIVGGSYQLGSVSADVTFSAIKQGADVVYVAGELRQAVFSIMSQPEIRTYNDLRGGKVIGAASVRGGTSTLLRAMFAQNGLREGEDFSMVAAGSTSERVAALRGRAIDAGLFAQAQDFMMRDEGFTLLGTTQ